jgi:NAD(P)-dependent dehydrogenase (short-subunit alcohol dehydrogenase family)
VSGGTASNGVPAPETGEENAPRRFVVVGASRGIGLELCHQLADAGFEVFALARRPMESARLRALCERSEGRVLQHACDVENEYSVQDAAVAVDAAWESFDVLIHNAGVYGRGESSLVEMPIDDVRSVFETNVLGALRVVKAFLPAIRRHAGTAAARGQAPGVLFLTSLMGSLADNTSGGHTPYRVSKTALNMLHKNLSIELDGSGCWSVALHPGWVRTDMGGESAPLSVEDAVRSIQSTLLRLGAGDNGRFVDRDGGDLPW